jgi:pyridoxamine 5'-phosphate oxidase family protein
MAEFSEHELRYLREGGRLGRLATVGADGTPHVTPVGWSVSPSLDGIEVGGRDFERSKKFRDARDRGRAAIVVDDLLSTDPWRPRGVEVRGRVEVLDDPVRIRIQADRVVSWGLDA